ncbi:hypothetical protein EV122DRAFT_256631 [Schizophyllum commune]
MERQITADDLRGLSKTKIIDEFVAPQLERWKSHSSRKAGSFRAQDLKTFLADPAHGFLTTKPPPLSGFASNYGVFDASAPNQQPPPNVDLERAIAKGATARNSRSAPESTSQTRHFVSREKVALHREGSVILGRSDDPPPAPLAAEVIPMSIFLSNATSASESVRRIGVDLDLTADRSGCVNHSQLYVSVKELMRGLRNNRGFQLLSDGYILKLYAPHPVDADFKQSIAVLNSAPDTQGDDLACDACLVDRVLVHVKNGRPILYLTYEPMNGEVLHEQSKLQRTRVRPRQDGDEGDEGARIRKVQRMNEEPTAAMKEVEWLKGILQETDEWENFRANKGKKLNNRDLVAHWNVANEIMEKYNNYPSPFGVRRKIKKTTIYAATGYGEGFFTGAGDVTKLLKTFGRDGTHPAEAVYERCESTELTDGGKLKEFITKYGLSHLRDCVTFDEETLHSVNPYPTPDAADTPPPEYITAVSAYVFAVQVAGEHSYFWTLTDEQQFCYHAPVHRAGSRDELKEWGALRRLQAALNAAAAHSDRIEHEKSTSGLRAQSQAAAGVEPDMSLDELNNVRSRVLGDKRPEKVHTQVLRQVLAPHGAPHIYAPSPPSARVVQIARQRNVPLPPEQMGVVVRLVSMHLSALVVMKYERGGRGRRSAGRWWSWTSWQMMWKMQWG